MFIKDTIFHSTHNCSAHPKRQSLLHAKKLGFHTLTPEVKNYSSSRDSAIVAFNSRPSEAYKCNVPRQQTGLITEKLC